MNCKELTDSEVATLEARTNLCSKVSDRDRDGLALLARKLSDFNASEARDFCDAVVMLGKAVDNGYSFVCIRHGGKQFVQLLTYSKAEEFNEEFEAEFGCELLNLVSERIMKVAAKGDSLTEEMKKMEVNPIYGSAAAKTVHPDEDCVLPGCDRYGGNDTYLRIRKVLGHKGAFDFCMGNIIKLVDRWEKKGDPAQNLEKLRDYSAQALVEWRLWNEKLS